MQSGTTKLLFSALVLLWFGFPSGVGGQDRDAGPSVVRVLPTVVPAGTTTFDMEVAVSLPASLPSGLIIDQQLPNGWHVSSAVWRTGRGDYIHDPMELDGTWKWLFDPLGVPASNGTMSVSIEVDADAETGVLPMDGRVKWLDHGAECELPVAGDELMGAFYLRIRSGWNLLALPFKVAEGESFEQALAASGGVRLVLGRPYLWDTDRQVYVQADTLILAKHGFWAYGSPQGITRLMMGAVRDSSITLEPGWNLAGVPWEVAFDDLAAKAGISFGGWWWDTVGCVYRPLGAGDVLEPGLGYWLHCDEHEQIVIELDGVPSGEARHRTR